MMHNFHNAIDEVIPRMSIIKASEIYNIYSVLITREINGSL
jgi:hypothetical protein